MDTCTSLYEPHKESNGSSIVFLNQISTVKCNFLESTIFYIWYPLQALVLFKKIAFEKWINAMETI